MYDREAFENVASEIALWESAALRLPSPELRAMLADWQHELAESLNAFNGIYLNHADHDEPGSAYAHSIGAVTRRATAVAIFTLGHHPAPAPGGAAELTSVPGLGDGHPPARPATTHSPTR